MHSIYHMVPPNLTGSTLYSLFELKKKFPKLYDSQVAKYDDHPERKKLPNKKVPLLNCKRGDVIHFMPIHPNLIYKGITSYYEDKKVSRLFYKIPFSLLSKKEVVLFNLNHKDYKFELEEDPVSIFSYLNINNYKEIKSLPKRQLESYEWSKANGIKNPYICPYIPHVWLKGSLNVEGVEIIDWRDDVK